MSMFCQSCGGKTRVVDSRAERRRRECLKCKARFSTIELVVDDNDTPVVPAAVARPAPVKRVRPARGPAKPPAPARTPRKEQEYRGSVRLRIEELRDARALKELDDDYP